MTHPDLERLDLARARMAHEVTADRGEWMSVFVDQRAGADVHLVESVLRRLRETIATTREATQGVVDPHRDVRLRVEWIELAGRRVLLLVMGAPS